MSHKSHITLAVTSIFLLYYDALLLSRSFKTTEDMVINTTVISIFNLVLFDLKQFVGIVPFATSAIPFFLFGDNFVNSYIYFMYNFLKTV